MCATPAPTARSASSAPRRKACCGTPSTATAPIATTCCGRWWPATGDPTAIWRRRSSLIARHHRPLRLGHFQGCPGRFFIRGRRAARRLRCGRGDRRRVRSAARLRLRLRPARRTGGAGAAGRARRVAAAAPRPGRRGDRRPSVRRPAGAARGRRPAGPERHAGCSRRGCSATRLPGGGAVECLLVRREPDAGRRRAARRDLERAGPSGATPASRHRAGLRGPGRHAARPRPRPPLPRPAARCGSGLPTAGRCATPCTTAGTCRCRPTSAVPTQPSRSRSLPDGVRAAEGSIAAPTAGLHFTPALLDGAGRRRRRDDDDHPARRLRHVPAGARRVRRDHRMETEDYEVSAAAAAALTARARDRPAHRGRRHDDDANARVTGARLPTGGCRAGRGIHGAVHRARARLPPGRRDGHELPRPRSSLLMLVSAFAGVDADTPGLRPRRGRALPVLQLRRRDADSLTAARG